MKDDSLFYRIFKHIEMRYLYKPKVFKVTFYTDAYFQCQNRSRDQNWWISSI